MKGPLEAWIQRMSIVKVAILSKATYRCIQCDLWNHGRGIFITLGNSVTYRRSFTDGPVMVVDQKPEALNLTNNSLQ